METRSPEGACFRIPAGNRLPDVAGLPDVATKATDEPEFSPDKALEPYSKPLTLLLLLVLAAGVLTVFNRAPWLDLAATELFFRVETCTRVVEAPARCGWFPISYQFPWPFLRKILQSLPVAAALAVLVTLGWNHRTRRLPEGWPATALVVLASGAASCLLIVNLALKEHWGRPRPPSIDIFGGQSSFVPVGEISTMCKANCSFVSSEGTAAFFVVTLVVLLPRQWQRAMFALALGVALFTSALRVAFGAHFVSDVVVGALLPPITLSAFATAARWLGRRERTAEQMGKSRAGSR